jgi:hypothetical protein
VSCSGPLVDAVVLPASRGWQTFGMDEVQTLVAEQVAYYRAHAPDYDDAYLGKDWDRCVEELPIAGDVLELACGTGHWTPSNACWSSGRLGPPRPGMGTARSVAVRRP